MPPQPSDLELLRLECDVRDAPESVGREPVPAVAVLAVTVAGDRSVVLPRPLPGISDGELPDSADELCVALADFLGPLVVRGGPCWLAMPPLPIDPALEVARWTDPGIAGRVLPHRVPSWEADEWSALVLGGSGPWAMVLAGSRVTGICHTARDHPAGVEAGTWTDPGYRGRGHAATATAVWAALPAMGGRHIFYSTTSDNASSRRVAERLGLRLLGDLWSIRRAGE